jgi:redox-sensing transcriptional repressor
MGIVGIGNLGTALLQHQNFPARGFNFVAAYDCDADKIGKALSSGLVIRNIESLKTSVRELEIEIGVITTPPSVAQEIADVFLDSYVSAILNFSPTQIHVPECCLVENIDFTVKLDILTYKLKHEMRVRIPKIQPMELHSGG